jgi:hypothetical protein
MLKSQTKWLLIALAALTVLVIPWTLSMFAGQHSFHEVNDVKTGCSKCHQDIWYELDNSSTIDKHKRAANNTNYTTYMYLGGISFNKTASESLDNIPGNYPVIYTIGFEGNTIGDNSTYDNGDIAYFWNGTVSEWQKAEWNTGSDYFDSANEFKNISIEIDGIPGISTDEVCSICHNITLFGLSGTHTKKIVRVCDDDRCHGNRNNSYNDPDLFVNSPILLTNVGFNLSSSIHAAFYLKASNESSPYVAGIPFGHTAGNEYDTYISQGYWTCMGCHSGAQVDITFIEAEPYDHSNFNAEKERYK